MALTVPAVPVDEAIEEIVEAYISHHVMPRDPLGDALHLALASYNKFDHLLTWNCDQLANANRFGHIRRINAILGLHTPNLAKLAPQTDKHPGMHIRNAGFWMLDTGQTILASIQKSASRSALYG